MMFEHMLEENNLLKEFENHGLKDRDITFIKEQITGPDNGRTNVCRSQMCFLFSSVHETLTVTRILTKYDTDACFFL